MSLIDEYFKYFEKYRDRYGDGVVVLMEVGSFFEIYGVDSEEEKIGNVQEISRLLNIQMTRKNKKIEKTSRKNPLLCGIPSISLNKYLDVLLRESRYTVVLVEQVTPPPQPKREVTKIYSPGTLIDIQTYDSNFLTSIYIEELNDKKLIGAISSIDISTGRSYTFEIHTISSDRDSVIDELFKYLQTFPSQEFILNFINVKDSDIYIKKLGLSSSIIHVKSEIDKKIKDLNYQNMLLKESFDLKNSMLSPIEELDFEFRIYSLYSYISLIDFIYDHNRSLIYRLNKPIFWENSTRLELNNSAIYQLNILPTKESIESGNRFNSLFSVIDMTHTSIGKRLLKHRLTNPSIDIDELNRRYSLIESMGNVDKKIKSSLIEISDIERLQRKLKLNILQPGELYSLYNSYKSIYDLMRYLKECDINILDNREGSDETLKKLIDYIEEQFKVDILFKYNIDGVEENIFNPHIDTEIDRVDYELSSIFKFVDKIRREIDSDGLKLEKNERDKFYFISTNSKSGGIKKNITDRRSFTINDTNIDISEFRYKRLSQITKITHPILNDMYDRYLIKEAELKKLVKDRYAKTLNDIYSRYGDIFNSLVNFVGITDVSLSGYYVKERYRYTKPIIEKYSTSFVKAKGLRHPIIERINENEIYVPNNIELGKDINGMLIYGVNASGKSSLMKSLGLSVILAQIGYYVPAKSFKYYPFNKIFTRIHGHDNLFKGLSSFAVEMSELRTILNRADNNSLVLGDEISHGTETISGLSIVASAVIMLAKKDVKFMFATHLHKLGSMEEINSLNSVEHYHLKVYYDEIKERLIYDRKLEKGVGDPIYGLEVAKAMDLDSEFLSIANQLREKFIKEDPFYKKIKPIKNRKHNIYVNRCIICGGPVEEIHHINEQRISDEKGYIDHFHKDNRANLLPLCNKCHKKIHGGEIEIERQSTGKSNTINIK